MSTPRRPAPRSSAAPMMAAFLLSPSVTAREATRRRLGGIAQLTPAAGAQAAGWTVGLPAHAPAKSRSLVQCRKPSRATTRTAHTPRSPGRACPADWRGAHQRRTVVREQGELLHVLVHHGRANGPELDHTELLRVEEHREGSGSRTITLVVHELPRTDAGRARRAQAFLQIAPGDTAGIVSTTVTAATTPAATKCFRISLSLFRRFRTPTSSARPELIVTPSPQFDSPRGEQPGRLSATLERASPRGEVAQLVEHTAENRGVAGSIPALAIREVPQHRVPAGRRACIYFQRRPAPSAYCV